MIQMPLREVVENAHLPGVTLILSEVVAELSDVATAQQISAFGFAIGRRLAARVQLDHVVDLEDLERHLNRLWEDLNLGESRLEADNAAIVARHDPRAMRPDLLTLAARPFLLELLRGTFDTCFKDLGSSPSIQTCAIWNGRFIEIRHGQ